MKKIIVIFISLLTIIGCAAQESHKETDLQKDGLKGNIKTLESTKYIAYENFGRILRGEIIGISIFVYNEKGNFTGGKDYDANGNLLFRAERMYDEKENMLNEVMYNSNGKVLHNVSNVYDTKGNKIEMRNYDSEGTLIIRTTYVYNKNGDKIEENRYPKYRKPYQIQYKYNNKGRQIEEVNKDKVETTNDNGQIEEIEVEMKLITKYNLKGDKIEEENYFNDRLVSKKLYKYDQRGNKIEENFVSFSYDPSQKINYLYDNQNNMTELSKFDANNNLIERIVYKNDEKGNAIEEKYYGSDNLIKMIKELKIEYY